MGMGSNRGRGEDFEGGNLDSGPGGQVARLPQGGGAGGPGQQGRLRTTNQGDQKGQAERERQGQSVRFDRQILP